MGIKNDHFLEKKPVKLGKNPVLYVTNLKSFIQNLKNPVKLGKIWLNIKNLKYSYFQFNETR